jgi:hypothetical protein
MNALWILVSTLMPLLCQPQQPDKFLTEPNHPVTIFEKPLSSTRKLIVTCENLPLVLTPTEAAARKQTRESSPTVVLSSHLYAYSYIIVTKGGQRSIVWTMRQPSFGAITPGKANEASTSIEVYDVALQDNILLVLYQQDRRTQVNIVRLNAGQRVTPSRSGSKQPLVPVGREAVESPPGPGRIVERAGPLDGVAGGHILGPNSDGNVTVQLSHVVKQKDGSLRLTAYHLTHDAQGQEFWTPDPSNIYVSGETPGILDFKEANLQPQSVPGANK